MRYTSKMYVARPLSLYRNDPTILSDLPTESSGFLVFTDEETEGEDTCCWRASSDTGVKKLPFPQNKILNVDYTTPNGLTVSVERDKVWFLPVINQPLSSNRYYVIRAKGKHKGQACLCSKEDDMTTCCFCKHVKDVKPKVLDARNIYQQVEIIKRRNGFYAKSTVPDGYPPMFLKRKGWYVSTSSSFQCQLTEARGLNFSLRTNLPEINFPISNKCSSTVVVGKWYCPFVFVKEQEELKEQMENSLFYEMTLEQRWEEIYSCERQNTKSNTVCVSVKVQRETNSLFGMEAMRDDVGDGMIWYKTLGNGGGRNLGLSVVVDEKMRNIQKIGGWVGGGEREVLVEKTEEFTGEKWWKRFGCFVLVERFALKRMDGTMLLTCDYKHIHEIRSKWE